MANSSVEPRYSVLIASRNEGERLRLTLGDVARTAPPGDCEIIVVDDGSDDGSAADLPAGDVPTRTLRNEIPRGVAFSRARAAAAASGRYLAFLDAHSALSEGWLEGLAACLEDVGDRGIAVPALYGLDRETWSIDERLPPATACTIGNPFLDFSWCAPSEVEGRTSTCVIGGGAWMCTRSWYEFTGGLDGDMVAWGGENLDIALRTWIAGGWCLVALGVKVGHLYGTARPRVSTAGDIVYNKLRAAHNAFSNETFFRLIESLRLLKGFREGFDRFYEKRDSIWRLKNRYEVVRQRPDRWLIDTFRLPLWDHTSFYTAPWVDPLKRLRPSVSVVTEGAAQAAAVLEKTTYGNLDVLCLDGSARLEHPRAVVLETEAGADPGARANEAARRSDAEFIAFLHPDVIDFDVHWIEGFLLLFERRRRLLLACPRTRYEVSGEDAFDAVWDWDAPLFSRVRTKTAPSDSPFPAVSCPDTILFVRRKRFLELGGFDETTGRLSVPDLALRGWLSGSEAYCHPGIAATRGAAPKAAAPDDGASLHYAQVLPAVKCFSGGARIEAARARSPLAESLLGKHAASIAESRRRFLDGARFDEDWFFFRFGIGEP